LPQDERPPPAKRTHSLEDGFSQMSLTSTPVVARVERPMWSPEHVTVPSEVEGNVLSVYMGPQIVDSPAVEMDPNYNGVSRAGSNGASGDEPQDVEMKRSTWYEKDKDCASPTKPLAVCVLIASSRYCSSGS
jgi:hypothetical protein